MLLPTPLPDELFASVFARLGRLNGMSDLRDVAEQCFGSAECPSFVDARLNLPEFCARFGNAYGEPEKVLEQLTALGMRRCLGEINEGAWSALALGHESISVGALTFVGAAELRFCPSCRVEDFNQIGMTYWHRSHQFPILSRCMAHGDRLKKAVIKRVALHQSFPLPGDFSSEREADLPFSWNDCFATELATFSAMLMTQVRPNQGLLEQALLEGLWERGFLNGNGALRTSKLFEFLIPRICQGNMAEFPDEGLCVVRQIVRSICAPARGVAFGRALLLCALFGDWRIVAERCNWLDALGASAEYLVHDPHSQERDIPSVKEMHREKCLAYIADSTGSSRLGFTQQHYRSFRWLLHHDRAWLDHFLPVSERGGEQVSLF